MVTNDIIATRVDRLEVELHEVHAETEDHGRRLVRIERLVGVACAASLVTAPPDSAIGLAVEVALALLGW